MQVYKKIAKHKNVTYFFGANKVNSRHAVILADFSKHKKGRERVHSFMEHCVAWVDTKTKEILWDEDTEDIIEKNIIKNFVSLEL